MKKISNRKPKLKDEKRLDPIARTEYFSQFEKMNNGIEIPYLDIKTIDTVYYLLDYLKQNPAIQKLCIEVLHQRDTILRLLARNNTLTHLIFIGLYGQNNALLKENLDQGLIALASNQSLTKLNLFAWSFSLEGITQLLENNTLKALELFSLNNQKYNKIAAILSNNRNLEKLKLRNTVNPSVCYPLLKGHFNTLDLFYNPNLGDEGLKILLGFQTLTSLNLRHCQISNAGADSLSMLQSLKVLNLMNNGIDDHGIELISQHSTNITDYALSGPDISYQGIKLLLERKKKVLQSFHFEGPLKEGKGTGDNLADLFSDCSVLTHLALNGCNIGPQGVDSISKNPNLEHLDLSSNPLGNKGAYYLSTHPRLNSLYLANCEINDDGILVLASNLRLNRLNLDGNKFNLRGIIALAFNKTITEICFFYTDVSNFKIAWLFLLGNQTLRYCAIKYYHLSFASYASYAPLIQLGGRNFRLQKQFDTNVVNPELCTVTFLPKDIINMVLDFAKPASYPYQFGLFRKELTKEICDEMEREMRNALPELKQYFIDLKNGGLFWNDLTPEARSQMHQMLPQIEQNFIDIENELSDPRL